MDRLIEVERREDGVALVRMVDEAGDNAMSPRFVAELLAVLDEVERWRALKVVVLAGTVDVDSPVPAYSLIDEVGRERAFAEPAAALAELAGAIAQVSRRPNQR